MKTGTSSSVLFLGILGVCWACSSENEPTPGAGGSAGGGAAGLAGSGAAGSATAGATAGGSAGAGGSTAQGGVGGSTSIGGNAAGGASAQGGAGAGGVSGGTGGASGGNGGASGGPPSTDGLPFVGSCLLATHCTDEWDMTFGAAALQELCTSQQGTWSTGHCAVGNWKKKCTQDVFGGVYVQYLPADGVCALGFEELL